MTKTERHLHLVPAVAESTRRKVSGDSFRTEAAQAEFRRRWNVAMTKLAK